MIDRGIMVLVGAVLSTAVSTAGAQPSFRLLDEDPAVAGFHPLIMVVSRDGSSFGGTAWDGETKGFTLTDGTLRLLDRPDVAADDQLLLAGVASGGTFACGFARDSSDGYRSSAVRWGPDGVTQDLGALAVDGLSDTYASAISADGQTVAGYSLNADGWQAFRWTEAGGMVGLGDLQASPALHPRSSFASGVSEDGETVVGYASDGERMSLFRWTADTGMVDLDPGGEGSINFIANGSGVRAMTGGIQYLDGSGAMRAFRWSDAGVFEAIGELPGVTESYGWAISDDGRVVVGDYRLDSASGPRGFVWTPGDGMVNLAEHVEASTGLDLTGWSLQPWTVSGDGSIVAGIALYEGPGAIRYTSFIYELGFSCPADFNADGRLDFFDFAGFVAAFVAQDAAADSDGDGLFLFADVAAFVAGFNAGCP